MKKILFGLILVLLTMACVNTKEKIREEKVVKIQEEDFSKHKFTGHDLLKGYIINGDEIIFKVDTEFSKEELEKSLPEASEIKTITLTGSFTGWKDDVSFALKKTGETEWYLKKSLSELMIPGNSGYPEFAFYIEGQYSKNGKIRPTEAYIKPSEKLELGYKFSDQFTGKNNYLIVSESEDLSKIVENHYKAITIKKEFESKEELSNFRNVVVGDIKEKKLYRSYHPFIGSKKYDEELERIENVEKLIEKNEIKSIINLTDGEEIYTDERVPEYYKNLLENKNVLLEITKYKIVYFQSNSEEFANTMNRIGKFIIEKEAPFLIHCRLGTDRTGVTSAFLEAFMGATWEEIVSDYQKSNRVGMQEFRHENLLKYSFENALEKDPSKIANLSQELRNFFKNKAGLSNEELDIIYNKLSN